MLSVNVENRPNPIPGTGSDSTAAEVGSAGYLSFNGADASETVRGLRPVIHISLD